MRSREQNKFIYGKTVRFLWEKAKQSMPACRDGMAEGTALRIVLPGQEPFVKTAGADANCSIYVNGCKLMYYSVVS